VVALGALVAFAIADAFRSKGPSLSATPTDSTSSISTEEEPVLEPVPDGPQQEIEEIGNEWAVRFAAGPLRDACEFESQALCESFACERAGGVRIRNCEPPTSAFRNSFFGATVQNVEVHGYRAGAKFSNGEVVKLFGDGGTWTIIKVGGDVGGHYFLPADKEIERIGNNWAPLFAASRSGCPTRHMNQPACEQIVCERPGGVKIRNCTPLTRAFRKSFGAATVQEVEINGNRASAGFSNGAVVVFVSVDGTWFIRHVGRNGGQGLLR
jgi:hypothetical protein